MRIYYPDIDHGNSTPVVSPTGRALLIDVGIGIKSTLATDAHTLCLGADEQARDHDTGQVESGHDAGIDSDRVDSHGPQEPLVDVSGRTLTASGSGFPRRLCLAAAGIFLVVLAVIVAGWWPGGVKSDSPSNVSAQASDNDAVALDLGRQALLVWTPPGRRDGDAG